MVGTHYSFNQKSVSIVRAMQLETSVRKLRIKRSLGRVATCEKSWVLPWFSFWLESRLPSLASRADLSWSELIWAELSWATTSITASVLCTVRVPHHDGKGHSQLRRFSDWGPVPSPHVSPFRSLGIGATCGWEKAAIQSWHVCTAQMEPCCLYGSEKRWDTFFFSCWTPPFRCRMLGRSCSFVSGLPVDHVPWWHSSSESL